MDTEKRDAITCVLDTIEAALQELRSLILGEEDPLAAQLTPGARAIDTDGSYGYVVAVGPGWVNFAPDNLPFGVAPRVIPITDSLPVTLTIDNTPAVTPVDGACYLLLTRDGWCYSVWSDNTGWGAGGWTEGFAHEYKNLSLRTPVIRVFPIPTA